MEKEIKRGFCQCGCGERTKRIERNTTCKGYVKGEYYSYAKNHFGKIPRHGKESAHWKGGIVIENHGYKVIRKPKYYRSDSRGYVLEHIYLAEKAIGGPLPEGADVHHHGDKTDNTQLVICENRKYHHLLHIRKRAFDACGDVNKRKCNICKAYDSVENLVDRGSRGLHHPKCLSLYNKGRRKSKKNIYSQPEAGSM